MLMVHTQEITAEFAGFPLSVSIPPGCTCSEHPCAGCHRCATKTVIIDAAQRDDGACAQRLSITGSTEDMRRIFREALALL